MLDIQQHIVVVIVPRDCICRQAWVDVRHKVGVTRREKQTRGLDTNGQVFAFSNQQKHLRSQVFCTCGQGTHSVSPTESFSVQGSSTGLIQPNGHSQGLCRRVTGAVSGSESRRKRRIGKHALTHSAGVSRGGKQVRGYAVSAYENRGLLSRARPLNGHRRIVTIRTASEGIT